MSVVIERHGSTLTVELARPERSNALSAEAVEAILGAVTGKAAEGVTLAVFSGRGRNFCSGFDLTNLAAETDGDLLLRLVRLETLLQAIFHAPFVTLALAQGRVVGAGVDLVCACSLRTAAPGTTFLMPGWRFGVALGTRRLSHRVGHDEARQLLIGSRTFDAEHALRIGFLQRVAPVSEWTDAKTQALQFASTLTPEAVARALSLTCQDTRSEDMAALVQTAGQPGLQGRILAYKAGARSA